MSLIIDVMKWLEKQLTNYNNNFQQKINLCKKRFRILDTQNPFTYFTQVYFFIGNIISSFV